MSRGLKKDEDGNPIARLRLCHRCRKRFPTRELKYPPNGMRGRRYCEPCLAIIMTRLARASAGVNRDKYYQRTYGMTERAYGDMLQRQDGLCAICKNLPSHAPGTAPRLVVDHDHTTGLVRGLLCQRCNQGLGMFGDDVANLASAILYLTLAANHVNFLDSEDGALTA